MTNDEDCESKTTIDTLAADAITEIEKIETRELDEELGLGLNKVKCGLHAIMADNHHHV